MENQVRKFPINTQVLIKKHPFLPDTVGNVVGFDGEKYEVEFVNTYYFFSYKFLESELDFLPILSDNIVSQLENEQIKT